MNNFCMNSNTRRKKISIKQLEAQLQELEDFKSPRLELEQYATPPHIGAVMLNTINSTYDDLEDKLVADLGCGTGKLFIGSLLCGARLIYGFDIDSEALGCSLENLNYTFADNDQESDDHQHQSYRNLYRDCDNFQLIQADISTSHCDTFWTPFANFFDTVIMNPPFGTKKNTGLDMLFLKRAIDISQSVVYSLHKTSTRKFILSKCEEWGVKGEPIGQIRYNLENTYKFHRKKSVDIDVDLWRIQVN